MQKGKTLRHRIRRSRARGAFRFGRKELIGQAPELPDLRGHGPGNGNKVRSVRGRIRVSQALVWAELFQSGELPSTPARATAYRDKPTSLYIEGIPRHSPPRSSVHPGKTKRLLSECAIPRWERRHSPHAHLRLPPFPEAWLAKSDRDLFQTARRGNQALRP